MCPCMVDTGRPASMSTWSPYRNNNMGSALQSPFGSQLMSLEMVACRGGLRSLYIRPDGIVLHGLSSHIGSVPSWKPRLSVFDPHRAVLTCPSFHKPPYDFSGDYPPPLKNYTGVYVHGASEYRLRQSNAIAYYNALLGVFDLRDEVTGVLLKQTTVTEA